MSTTELSIIMTSCLTTIRKYVIKYCETFYERNSTGIFWSIKISCEILNKLYYILGFYHLVCLHMIFLRPIHVLHCLII